LGTFVKQIEVGRLAPIAAVMQPEALAFVAQPLHFMVALLKKHRIIWQLNECKQ